MGILPFGRVVLPRVSCRGCPRGPWGSRPPLPSPVPGGRGGTPLTQVSSRFPLGWVLAVDPPSARPSCRHSWSGAGCHRTGGWPSGAPSGMLRRRQRQSGCWGSGRGSAGGPSGGPAPTGAAAPTGSWRSAAHCPGRCSRSTSWGESRRRRAQGGCGARPPCHRSWNARSPWSCSGRWDPAALCCFIPRRRGGGMLPEMESWFSHCIGWSRGSGGQEVGPHCDRSVWKSHRTFSLGKTPPTRQLPRSRPFSVLVGRGGR